MTLTSVLEELLVMPAGCSWHLACEGFDPDAAVAPLRRAGGLVHRNSETLVNGHEPLRILTTSREEKMLQ